MNILEIAQKQGTYKEVSPREYAGPCPKCGGAMRLRIWPEKNVFACLGCSVEGNAKDFALMQYRCNRHHR